MIHLLGFTRDPRRVASLAYVYGPFVYVYRLPLVGVFVVWSREP